MTKATIFMKGFIRENPVLVLVLGLCPALYVSTSVSNALGLGAATMFVLLCSNTAISLLRKIIPEKVRIPSYIVLIASFVAMAQMIIEAYFFNLYLALGIFLPLIATNCIIFARAEIFANRNGTLNSIVDAIGMGAGFTLALFIIASIREILGNGTWFDVPLPYIGDFSVPIMALAPGGFVVFAVLIAIVNKITKGMAQQEKKLTCARCPQALACGLGREAIKKGGDER